MARHPDHPRPRRRRRGRRPRGVMYAGRVVESGPSTSCSTTPAAPVHLGPARLARRLDRRGRAADAIPGTPPPLLDLPPGCRFRPRCAHATTSAAQRPPLERAAPSNREPGPLLARPPAVGDAAAHAAVPTTGQRRSPLLVVTDLRQVLPDQGGLFGGRERRPGARRRRRRLSTRCAARRSALVGESGCGKTTLAGRSLR